MIFEYNPTDLGALCALASKEGPEVQKLVLKLGLLNLNDTEESLLGQLYPPDPQKMEAALSKYNLLIRPIRGKIEGAKPMLSVDQVSELKLTKELMQNGSFVSTLLRSLYVWIDENHYIVARQFLHQLNKFTEGNFNFSKRLDDDWPIFYTNVTVLLMTQFFEHTHPGYQMLLLESDLLILALRKGLDVDNALKRGVDDYAVLENRRELNLEYAAFVYNNKTAIGKKADKPEESGTSAYWIDAFGDFTQHKWNIEALDAFIDDKKILSKCSDEEVLVIGQLITLYTHAITEKYVLPDISPDELKRLVAEEEKRRAEANKNKKTEPVAAPKPAQPAPIPEPNWKELLTHKKQGMLREVEKWLAGESESRVAKQKVLSSIKGIDWKKEPALSVMLGMSELFERRFGEAGALVYFDQIAGSFEWNT